MWVDFGWVFCVLGWCVVVCLFEFGFWVFEWVCVFVLCLDFGFRLDEFRCDVICLVFGGVVLVWFTRGVGWCFLIWVYLV